MKAFALALCALLAAVFGTHAAADPVFPDRGRAAVVDAASVIPDAEEAALNSRIVGWVHKTGHQLAVVTVPSLQGYDIKEYGYHLGRAWGLGGKDRNDGAILLLGPTERKVRIEVGYGLEPVLTDGLTSQIVRGVVVPRLKAGDTSAALSDGAAAIMAAATPVAALDTRHASADDGRSIWPWLLCGFMSVLAAAIIAGVRSINAERRRTIQRMEQRRAPMKADTALRQPQSLRGWAPPTASHSSAVPSPAPTRAVSGRSPQREPARRCEDASFASSAAAFGAGFGLGSSSSSSSDSSSSWGSSDSSSSSSGFDSGGGSFGGGGSDSSY
jgi:uncharacterized protein